jgi:polyhydroxyalkanoate synthase
MTAEKSAHLADAAAPVDALFVDAALGPVHRFTPDRSTAKWVVSLARQPRTIGRRLGVLGGEARRIVAGTSTLSPEGGDRRFKDVAWMENPILKRALQLYLAGAQIRATADLTRL